jgi:hypothetical protein
MFLASFDRPEVPTHTERVRLLLKLRFLIFASRLSELTLEVELAFSPSPELKGKIFFCWFYI